MGFLDKFPLRKHVSSLDTEIDGDMVTFERAFDVAQKIAIDSVTKTKHLPDQERKSILRKLKEMKSVNPSEGWQLTKSKYDDHLSQKELQEKIGQHILEEIKNIIHGEARLPADFKETSEEIIRKIKNKLQIS